MDDETKPGWLKWGLGVVGVGALVGAATIRIWMALVVLLLAILLFGGLLLLRWWSRKRAGGRIIQNVGQESGQAVSQAESRAELDSLLGRFKTGLKEFDRAGYSVYDYPWFVVIGESGAGKTEALRSALEDQVPSSVRHHIPPRDKGTKDFVWWFTKHGIVLDTAGRMVVGEGGNSKDEAWRLFLKSLRKSRPRCPVNGLLLALSAESLIKDSAEKISEKATQLGQKIEMIQRELDVRFPVYLLVTKCDLLTGFREFTERIEDPQLQHQIFGWSNPAPLDDPFQPELVLDHLIGVVEQVKRRRLALLRLAEPGSRRLGDTDHFFAAGYQLGQAAGPPRRMDEMDSLFAFAESLLRLEPRLRRYLDTIFVAGPFSPKPVFLRGIYFTSAMREGRALDEAMALITGTGLENLPEDRSWDRNKSFFLRDLVVEKVVHEKGLVTRAKNTLKVLRQRQYLIFGTAGVAMVLLLGFAFFGYRKLDKSAREEARFWGAASTNWASQSEWSPPIVKLAENTGDRYAYNGNAPMPGLENFTVAKYHKTLQYLAEDRLHVPLIFWPVYVFGRGPNKNRLPAQRDVVLGGIIQPLFARTREKMRRQEPNPASLQRHQDALLELIRLEAAALKPSALDSNRTFACLSVLLSYLTETNAVPEPSLVNIVTSAYREKEAWPPPRTNLLGGSSLSNNTAIDIGLNNLKKAGDQAQVRIQTDFRELTNLATLLNEYRTAESIWAVDPKCQREELQSKMQAIREKWKVMLDETNLTMRIARLERDASRASASPIMTEVGILLSNVPESKKSSSIVKEIAEKLETFGKQAVAPIDKWSGENKALADTLDKDLLAGTPPAFESRWSLYTNACAIGSANATAALEDVGQKWQRFQQMKILATNYENLLKNYHGPLATQTLNACSTIANRAQRELKSGYVSSYVDLVSQRLTGLASQAAWEERGISNARVFFLGVSADLEAKGGLEPEDQEKVAPLAGMMSRSKEKVLGSLAANFSSGLGFPLRLLDTNGTVKTAKELVQTRKLATYLSSELGNPVWGDTAGRLKKECELYAPILNVLVDTNGSAMEWDLSFVGPAKGSSDDIIAAIYRSLKLNGATPVDLGHTYNPNLLKLGVMRADDALTLELSGGQEPKRNSKPNWWLPRLLAESGWEENGAWRFKMPLESTQGGTTYKGSVVFEVEPKKKTTLPRLSDWSGGSN